MNWFSRFFRAWNIDAVRPPWADRPSIYAFLATQAPNRDVSEIELPDAERVYAEGKIRFAAGAFDGVFGGADDQAQASIMAADVVDALKGVTRMSTDANASRLYDLVISRPALSYVDALLEAVVARSDWDSDRLYHVARWLASEAADRDAVKIGIALLGLFREADSSDVLMQLARHEEFTLYAIVALQNTANDWEIRLHEIAQSVRGWGRIHIIERLRETTNEHIQAWMLREGFRNAIMDEYTALTCARAGDLVTALELPNPDDALVAGASRILDAIVRGRGGPAPGIEDYEDGPRVLEVYLDIIGRREMTMQDYLTVRAIDEFLHDDDEQFGSAGERWKSVRVRLAMVADTILSRPDWPERIRERVEAEDADYHEAVTAARAIGVDTWDVAFRRLQRGLNEWWHVMQTDDRDRIERVVAFAETTLPLDQIAVGPDNQLGIGPGFEAHNALDFVLQDLRRFEEIGWRLVRTGMLSPVTRNRNMAARVLASWPRHTWPADANALLLEAIEREPDPDTRDYLEKVSRGGAEPE